MKINKLCLGLVGMMALVFSACSSDEDYTSGDWNATSDYANVAFVETTKSIELDPTDATTVPIQLERRNTKGSVTVPITIEENDGNVFSITQATFADGDSLTTIYANFPSAEVGKPYTMKLQISDPTVASYYSSNTIYTLSVTRVKWNDAGYYIDAKGNKVTGYAYYTDDLMTTFYGVSNKTFLTKLQERADKPGYYRLINTYGANYPYNESGDWDASKEYYIFIDATNPKKVFIPKVCETGLKWSDGMFSVYSLAGYYLAKDNADKAADYYGTYANGKITFPKNALLASLAGYKSGALYQGNASGAFKLVIDPSQDLYEAKVPDDFKFKDVYTGQFTSNQLSKVTTAKLQKGEITTTKDGCDSVFKEKYGTLYKIVAPYADGYDLLFTVKSDGTIMVPEGYELQETGMTAVGAKVYAKINAAASTYTDKEITLNITFQNEDGTVVYGTTKEIIANITYTKVGTGDYTYAAMVQETDKGYTLSKRDDKDNVYKISDWFYGVDFIFTWDKTTNNCTVASQYSGYTHSTYGQVFVADLPNYKSTLSYTDYPCYYDPATSTFHFYLVYYVSGGTFGHADETFQVTWDATGAKGMVRATKNVSVNTSKLRLNRSLKRSSRLIPHRVEIKSTLNPFMKFFGYDTPLL
jgi:hypothetical protein